MCACVCVYVCVRARVCVMEQNTIHSGALPLAATLNWIIKDGMGQFGGILFASLVNNKFDADPKRWRMVAAVTMDASCKLYAL